MRRFQFTLQAVALLRDREKNAALEAYANALARHRQAATELAFIDESIQRAGDAWCRQSQAGAFRAADAVQARQHLTQLQDFRRHRAQVLAKANEALQLATKAMHQAHQACEVMEKLREHQLRDHQLAADREERRVLDELASRATFPGRPGIERRVVHD